MTTASPPPPRRPLPPLRPAVSVSPAPLRTTPVAAAPSPGAPARWRFARLFSAPHRLAFAAGMVMLALVAAWWAALLLLQAEGVVPRWGLPPGVAHGLLFGYGFMPLFFVGFLFTAGPKWLGRPDVPARALQGPIGAQLAGWGVFLLGLHGEPARAASFAALGLGAVALGWGALTWRFVGLLRASEVPDRVHATLVAAASLAGTALLAASAVLAGLGQIAALRAVAMAGLWLFIGTVYVAVTHRMIPFFTASALPLLDAWRPRWLLVVFAVTMVLQALFVGIDALVWPAPAAWRIAQALIESVTAALLLWLAARWGLVQSLKIRLLAMLHVGFLWLGLALALQAVSHAMQAATGDALSLGLAPLHAYTMGFLVSTLVAMATRVSAGHSGRPLAADDIAWRLFWLLQAVVVLRVAAALAPALGTWAVPLAALAFGAVAVAWALRHGRWYGTPRADGRPG